MKVIVPCCGRSTRFPNQPPKWMLPSHDGRPMVSLAVEDLAVSAADLVITILREHEETFRVSRGLCEVFGEALQVVILDEPTRSQAETVAVTLQTLALSEPFLVKDSDNAFALEGAIGDHNFVCVDSLNNHDSINPRNKSYLQVDHQGFVTNIREKVVISDLFSVGGYFFREPDAFVEQYRRLLGSAAPWQRELYVSDVIGAMLLEGVPFVARPVSRYRDWGTITEWARALSARRTFLVMLDGFVFERGSQHFHPRFEEVRAQPAAVAVLRELAEQAHTLVYLSTRPAALAGLTERQLAENGLPSGTIVYGCPVSPWTLLTAPHATLPFRTGQALEVPADDPNLAAKIAGVL